jgi:hypothetical protein
VTGLGDEISAAGRGHFLAADTDREHVVGTLKAAFVQGRLTKDELELRAGQAFISRTYAELARITADLPTGLMAVPPARGAARARPPVNSSLRTASTIVATVAMLTAFLWAAAFLTENYRIVEVTFLATLADFAIIPMIGFVAAAQVIDARQRKQSGGQEPPPSSRGPGGRGSRRAAPAGPARLPRLSHDERRHLTEATLRSTPSRRWTAGSNRIRSVITVVATRSA